MPSPDAPVLNVRRLLLWPLIFVAVLYSGHKLVRLVRRFTWFDCPPHWPLSIFNPRGPHAPIEFAAIAATIALGIVAIRWLPRRGYRTGDVAVCGLLLILCSNAIQGVPKGFYNPIAGGRAPEQYYHDSRHVTSARAFLAEFATIQPALHTHARTHPPGAVLLFYGMRRVIGDYPAAMAVLIAVAATLLSAWAFPQFVVRLLEADRAFAGYATLVYLLLPAVQIYYCATLDALICALLLAAVAVWSGPPTWRNTLAACLFVAGASYLTFGFVWVLPVLFAFDWRRARGFRILYPLLALTLLYGALYLAFGFDYIAACRLASHLENPRGYRLLVEPISFGFTRIEDVSEILVFFGPYLIALAGIGLKRLRRSLSANTAVLAAVATLLLLFLTGAYHTGETARACLFIYPFLLLPALLTLRGLSEPERTTILYLVLAQTVVMQTCGNFFW